MHGGLTDRGQRLQCSLVLHEGRRSYLASWTLFWEMWVRRKFDDSVRPIYRPRALTFRSVIGDRIALLESCAGKFQFLADRILACFCSGSLRAIRPGWPTASFLLRVAQTSVLPGAEAVYNPRFFLPILPTFPLPPHQRWSRGFLSSPQLPLPLRQTPTSSRVCWEPQPTSQGSISSPTMPSNSTF